MARRRRAGSKSPDRPIDPLASLSLAIDEEEAQAAATEGVDLTDDAPRVTTWAEDFAQASWAAGEGPAVIDDPSSEPASEHLADLAAEPVTEPVDEDPKTFDGGYLDVPVGEADEEVPTHPAPVEHVVEEKWDIEVDGGEPPSAFLTAYLEPDCHDAEQKRLATLKAEEARHVAAQAAARRAEAADRERARRAALHAERSRLTAEASEAERIVTEQAEADRIERERLTAQYAEDAEAARLAAKQTEVERQAIEKAAKAAAPQAPKRAAPSADVPTASGHSTPRDRHGRSSEPIPRFVEFRAGSVLRYVFAVLFTLFSVGAVVAIFWAVSEGSGDAVLGAAGLIALSMASWWALLNWSPPIVAISNGLLEVYRGSKADSWDLRDPETEITYRGRPSSPTWRAVLRTEGGKSVAISARNVDAAQFIEIVEHYQAADPEVDGG